MLKKQIYILASILLLLSFSLIMRAKSSECKMNSCDCDNSGKSFFAPRPQFQSASPELISAFREDRLHARKDGIGGDLEFVLFGGTSVHNKNLTRYFTPFCKTQLAAQELVGPGIVSDLQAQHFGIVTKNGDFSSEISFEPAQSTIALGLYYRQSFWHHEEKNRDWFFSISSPLTHIKNQFKLTENIINDGGGIEPIAGQNIVANMTQAFAQQAWNYGRIESKITSDGTNTNCSSCPQTKTGLADIEVKLGMEWLNCTKYHLESYTGILIPTGNRPNGVHIFQPIVGNGKHTGLMFGSAGNFELWQNSCGDRVIKAECATHSVYLFSARQIRSVDLKNKPFSRYMEVYANKAQAAQAVDLLAQANAAPAGSPQATALFRQATNLSTPGINIFTLPVNVTPGFQFNITTALTFTFGKGYQLEGGYNFFARKAECVKLACPWDLGPALKKIDGNGQTNPARDITGNVFLNSINIAQTDFANYDDNVIQQTDLDMNSAAHPAGISHTFYGSFGYRADELCYPIMAHVGGSYEFANESNASIDRWTLWTKFGVSF